MSTSVTTTSPAPARAQRAGAGGPPSATANRWRRVWRRTGIAWLFLAPALIIFTVFKFIPAAYGVWMSFFKVRPYLGNQWIGTQNFERAFSDPLLADAAWHTVINAVCVVAGSMLLGFVLALLLEGPALHLRVVRTGVFLPVVVSAVVIAQLWNVLMYPADYGALNSVLGLFGIPPQQFLSSPDQALPSVIAVQIWAHAPYDMVIYIAGLAGIDRNLYEAADIDGANRWQRLWYVTIPSLRPIITIILVLGVIRGLRVFTSVYVLTGGGPAGATEMIVTYMFKTGINLGDLGYASTISTLLLLATVVLTCITLWWRSRKED